MRTAQQCGRISKEDSGFRRRSFSVRMRVGIMETLHGKESAPNAGESEPVKLELRGKTQGKHTHNDNHSDSKDHLDFEG